MARTPGKHRSTLLLIAFLSAASGTCATAATIAGHTVVLDAQGKIVPWFSPAAHAYDEFLDRRWSFIKTRVPLSPGPAPRSDYPQYYFYDGFVTTSPAITPDNWMNDVGEKIPNWFESARLYYAYTGDASVMILVRDLMDYTIAHGTSPTNFAWPNFPHTTTRYGDLEFEGFTPTFALHEVQVDHAGDMGLACFRLYQFTGDPKYLTNALHVADVLAANARTGTATQSVWPYRVRLDTGAITAQYGANWIGCYALLDSLIMAGLGNTNAYLQARTKARDFLLQFPMQTGYWTDGHSDNPVNSSTYKSNMGKSNTALYMYDHPEFDPDWRNHLPALIQWTEDNFVVRTTGGEPSTAYGANIVGEQDGFLIKMDYQTARYAAECARWYRLSGDTNYLEKAYRCLNWVTYCSDAEGRATESPYSLNIATWWSDCYGECPRMFYPAFAAMPEWAPPGEDHILYSEGILTNVAYSTGLIRYTATEATGTEYLRLSYLPSQVTLAGSAVLQTTNLTVEGWGARALGGGDYAVTVHHTNRGEVRIAADTNTLPPSVSLTGPANGASFSAPALVTLSASATGYAGPVTNVEFFSGATWLGHVTTAPYGFIWSNVPIGSYTLTARASDSHGLSRTSAAVSITVALAAPDPAFIGSTNEGAFTDNIWADGAWINACRFAADTDLTVSNMFAKVTAVTGRYQCAIYSDAGGSASRFLRGTLEVTNPADGWQTFPLTGPLTLTNGHFYWLAIWSDAANARVYAENGGTIRWGQYDYGAWPDPVNLTGSGGYLYSIYAGGSEVSGNPNAPTITIDAAQTYQVIDGFGVNANHRSWTNAELRPALDALIDQAGMTLFRIVFDNTDWETTNDNSNASVMDWAKFNAIYSAPKFQPLWDMFAYLNQRGLSNGVFLNFMGPGPAWMGGGTLPVGMEEEWAETIASLLVHARTTRGLKFSLIAPNNEPDISNEGITMSATRYSNCLHQLAQKLDASGLGDVRFVAPDRAGGGTAYMPELLADPVIMGKVAHFGIHSYSDNGGGSGGVYDFIRNSAYADRTFWMTEFNVWCNGCDSGQRGNYEWNYCRATASYLLHHLANGASGGIVWEGYDSFYLHPPSTWSFWGLLAVDNENAIPKTYTPRKNFYTMAQISKFVRPGARRIDVSGATAPFSPLLAFYHADLRQLTIVGINTSGSAAPLRTSLGTLPAVTTLGLHYTTANTNLAAGGSFPVTNGVLGATIPADCVFTLVSPPITPKLSHDRQGASLLLSWPTNFAAFTPEYTTNLPAANWLPHPSPPAVVNGHLTVTSTMSGPREFHRLRQP